MPITAISYALQLLTSLPQLIQAGADVMDMVQTSAAKLKLMHDENREPSAAEWEDLNNRIQTLRDELHAP